MQESLVYKQIFSYRVTLPPSGHRLDAQLASKDKATIFLITPLVTELLVAILGI